MDFAGKTVLITGAAGGIGAAAAAAFAKEGVALALVDLDRAALESTAARLGLADDRVLLHVADVRDEQQVESYVAAARERFGSIDAFFNNAASRAPPARWSTPTSRRSTRCSPRTSAARSSVPRLAAYNANKGEVKILTKSAALHCGEAGYGIRVNSVCPGYVWTPMLQGVIAKTGNDVVEMRAALTAMHPIGRLADPADIGWAIVYLASDESTFVTGTELLVVGGYTAR